MNELTTEEHNFLRWLFENIVDSDNNIAYTKNLTYKQKELLASIRSKLLMLSSY